MHQSYSDPDLCMDNASAPSTFYPLEPGKPGKFIFITGIPGSGKSKIAQLMAQKFGFKYYEGDATWYENNPYIPLDSEEPSLSSYEQKPMHFSKNCSSDKARYTRLYYHMKQERDRLGGDFVVVWAFADTEKERNEIRNILGPEMIFVILSIDAKLAHQRKYNRDQDVSENEKVSAEEYWECELANESELNAVNIEITEEMKPEDVVVKLFQSI